MLSVVVGSARSLEACFKSAHNLETTLRRSIGLNYSPEQANEQTMKVISLFIATITLMSTVADARVIRGQGRPNFAQDEDHEFYGRALKKSAVSLGGVFALICFVFEDVCCIHRSLLNIWMLLTLYSFLHATVATPLDAFWSLKRILGKGK